jgi:hypothetical protein
VVDDLSNMRLTDRLIDDAARDATTARIEALHEFADTEIKGAPNFWTPSARRD